MSAASIRLTALASAATLATSFLVSPAIYADVPASPASPETINFNFIRGIVRSFQPGQSLAIITPDDEVRRFVMSKEASVVNPAGKPLEKAALEPGADVTVTVAAPREADAASVVYRIVVANPLAEKEGRKIFEGLVVNARKGQNVITVRPEGSGERENVSILYGEGETNFVGADGIDVDEGQLQAGDRILIYINTQEDGGFLAERIIFLGQSGESASDDDLIGF